jgi:hypothetical protein
MQVLSSQRGSAATPTCAGRTKSPDTALAHEPQAKRHAVRCSEMLRLGVRTSGPHARGTNSDCSGKCLQLLRMAPLQNNLPYGGATKPILRSGRGKRSFTPYEARKMVYAWARSESIGHCFCS